MMSAVCYLTQNFVTKRHSFEGVLLKWKHHMLLQNHKNMLSEMVGKSRGQCQKAFLAARCRFKPHQLSKHAHYGSSLIACIVRGRMQTPDQWSAGGSLPDLFVSSEQSRTLISHLPLHLEVIYPLIKPWSLLQICPYNHKPLLPDIWLMHADHYPRSHAMPIFGSQTVLAVVNMERFMANLCQGRFNGTWWKYSLTFLSAYSPTPSHAAEAD